MLSACNSTAESVDGGAGQEQESPENEQETGAEEEPEDGADATADIREGDPAASVEVPAVARLGQQYEEARQVLEDAGFTVDREYHTRYVDGLPGSVLEQSPSAGEMAPTGSVVTLTVLAPADMLEQTVVPDVVGETVESATEQVSEADLYPIDFCSGPSDIVDATQPAAGESAPVQGNVSISCS
ncbi:hypothetical protein GCM10022245_55770 [Streptomyces mayteni]